MSLHAAVTAFKSWAATIPVAEQGGEWECHYPGWHELWAEAEQFIAQGAYENWSRRDKEALLFALARDNEDGVIADAARQRPDLLLSLADDALSFGEWEARWQIADALAAQAAPTAAVEALLLRFFADPDEYIRRRALLALGAIGAVSAEGSALSAWSSGIESQRMAALEALRLVASSKLKRYLRLAFEDGRTRLVSAAFRIGAEP